ncbi:Hypothetical protein NTJ_10854 [Nesidiocoris tenuis]|uniref:Gustatory receptor n=1 Tax=Nesidiocoris tenuis TaxID=355587 RepID=A0ABN7B0T5_9HEMI|nr:Hypothetical protein NTJ_10854 [Nesidiocoris tenuis]
MIKDPFHLQMKPLMRTLKIFGGTYLSENKEGKMEEKLLSLQGLYFIVAYSTQTCAWIVGNFFDVNMMDYFKSDAFSSQITGVMYLTLTGMQSATLVYVFINSGCLARYFNDWADFNNRFTCVMGYQHKFKYKKSIKILSLVSPVCILLCSHAATGIFRATRWYHIIMPAIIVTVTWTNFYIYLFSCLELMCIANAIDAKLKRILVDDRSSAEHLYKIRRLWICCSHLVKSVGTALAVTLYLQLGTCVVVFSISAFGTISGLLGLDFNAKIFASSFLVSFVTAFGFFDIGEWTTYAVCTKVKATLSSARVRSRNPHFSDEVEVFIEAILSNFCCVTLGGLATLSRKSLAPVMYAAVLNMVVLFQIQTSRNTK